ncbi:MAG: IS1595 family transposase [Saccharospirillaceae bacterium]|nr:IS1595 family transposase [Saccharospirillaceae bacterium]
MNIHTFKRMLNQIPKLDPAQKHTLSDALNTSENIILNKLAKQVIEHHCCIHCQSERIKKYGFSNGRQRFYCNACAKSFVCTRGSAYFYQHKPELWAKYLDKMLNKDSLRRCAKELGICLDTAFHWRHRYIQSTENTFEDKLEGIIEADETFFRESKKGERHLTRPARKRGTRASTRGINNHDWVKVLTAMDRNHHEYDHILNQISGDEINKCLGEKVANESVFCSDGQPAYNKICCEHHLHHVILKNNHCKQGVFHIQNINSYHSQLKHWYVKMHGVASKYLAQYLGWFRMLQWHGYQQFSQEANTEEKKFFEFKLLQVQQHNFRT